MPTRRTVLAGTAAAAAALACLPTPAHAAPAGPRPYRRRTAVIGGTGFVTGILFHPATAHPAYARTDTGGCRRDQDTARWTALTGHLGRDDWNLLGVEAVTGDPRVHGRVHLAANGRGIRYGEAA